MRILRPIKVLNNVPSLRKQVTALVYSVKGILNVAIFLIFIIFLFSVIGLQWFAGAMHYSCREGATPPLLGETWTQLEGVCTPENNRKPFSYIVKCPSDFGQNYSCGSPYDYGLNISDDEPLRNQ